MKFKLSLLSLLLFLLIIPTDASAEIASVRDWVGLFPINATGIKSNTVSLSTPLPAGFTDPHAWAYTSSCTQTPGTIPRLVRNNPLTGQPDSPCSFTVAFPLTGYYVFRLYANDKDDNTPDALITTSEQFPISSGTSTQPTRPSGKLYRITGDLTLNSDLTVNETGVIFVDGNLYINTNILNDNATKGLVFVVKGEIFIQRDVTKVNAFLVAHGKNSSGTDITPICTAYDPAAGCNDYADNATRKYLEINGSVISLSQNAAFPANFARKKYDSVLSDKPAETINYQAKYLVIMKDIFSRDLKIWREIQ